ncbi:MAG: glutamate--tRNA ligase [Candidatus Eisenbacteria bacterium]|nr:glutamate--tRNA ligase [Candidatus Eisenbacteria bacterium]
MSSSVRVRFAPSPTGHLHVGGARTALMNWLFAKHEGGSFVLRIEDTDIARSTAESESAVLEDLRWLGLLWDEGPDVGGSRGPYRQSERTDIYRERAERLVEEGKAFRCYCTDDELEEKRQEALEEGRHPHYDGTCRHLSEEERRAREAAGREPTIRLFGPEHDIRFEDVVRGEVVFRAPMLGDFIILRSDGRPTYNFAVVVDDQAMDITHVIRADDHLSNTMRQLLVAEALDAEPPRFAHVPLVVGRDRSKLSKREGATSVAEFREAGYLPEALVNYLALLGWSSPDAQELLSRDELVERFTLDRISSSAAAFDGDKLDWVNGHHIREEPLERIVELILPFLEAAGLPSDDERVPAIVDLVRENATRLPDIAVEAACFFDGSYDVEDEALEALAAEGASELLETLAAALEEPGGEDERTFKDTLKAVGKELGLKGAGLYMPVRAALTGRTHGPSLVEVARLLGPERIGERLKKAVRTARREAG